MLHSIAGKEKKVRIFGHLKNRDVTVHNSASHVTNNSSQINENITSMYSHLHANATLGLPPIQSQSFDITYHSLPKTRLLLSPASIELSLS